MKRKILFVLLIVGLAAMASAQGRERGEMPPRPPAPEAVTVSGDLIVAHGFPAIQSGNVTYIVGGINRLTGFVEGLKEGAKVIIEGLAMTNPRNTEIKFLRPSKLTLNEKTYDLSLPFSPFGQDKNPERNFGPRRPGPNTPQRFQRQSS